MAFQNKVIKLGGSGSGDWGHSGRPGEVGGSTSGPGGRDSRTSSGRVPSGSLLDLDADELSDSMLSDINKLSSTALSHLLNISTSEAQELIDIRNSFGDFDNISEVVNAGGDVDVGGGGISSLKDAPLLEDGQSLTQSIKGLIGKIFADDVPKDFQEVLDSLGFLVDEYDLTISEDALDDRFDNNSDAIDDVVNQLEIDPSIDTVELDRYVNAVIEQNRIGSDNLTDEEIVSLTQDYADQLLGVSFLNDLVDQINEDVGIGPAIGDAFAGETDIEVTPTDFPSPPTVDFDKTDAEFAKDELLQGVLNIGPLSEFEIDKQEIEQFILDIIPIDEVATFAISAADFVTSIIGNSIESIDGLLDSLTVDDSGDIQIVENPDFDLDAYIQGLLDAGIIVPSEKEEIGPDDVDAVTGASLNLSSEDFVIKLGSARSGHFSHLGTLGTVGGSLTGSSGHTTSSGDFLSGFISDAFDLFTTTVTDLFSPGSIRLVGLMIVFVNLRNDLGGVEIPDDVVDLLTDEVVSLVSDGVLPPKDIDQLVTGGLLPPKDIAQLVSGGVFPPKDIAVLVTGGLLPPKDIDAIIEVLPSDSVDDLIVDTVDDEAELSDTIVDSFSRIVTNTDTTVGTEAVTRFVNNSFDLFLLFLDLDLDISYEELFGLLVPASVSGSSSADIESDTARCSSLLSGLDIASLDQLSTDELVEILICLFSIKNINSF